MIKTATGWTRWSLSSSKRRRCCSVTNHVHGGIACVQKWLQGGDSLTVEELASMMYNALPLSVKTIRSMEVEPEKTPS